MGDNNSSEALTLLLSVVDAQDAQSVQRAKRILASRNNDVQDAIDAWFSGATGYEFTAAPAPAPAPAPVSAPDPIAPASSTTEAVQQQQQDQPADDSAARPLPQPPAQQPATAPLLLPPPEPKDTTTAMSSFPDSEQNDGIRRSERLKSKDKSEPKDLIDLSADDPPPAYAGANGGADDDAALAQALAASLADVEGTAHIAPEQPAASVPPYAPPPPTSEGQGQGPPPLPARPAPPQRSEVQSVQWKAPHMPPALLASHSFFQPPVALLQALYSLPSVRDLVLGMHLPSPKEGSMVDLRDFWRGRAPVWSKPDEPMPDARTSDDQPEADAPADAELQNDAPPDPQVGQAQDQTDAQTEPSLATYVTTQLASQLSIPDLVLLQNLQVLFTYMSTTQRAWIQVPDTFLGLSDGDSLNPWNRRWDPTAKSVWSLYGRLVRVLESYVEVVRSVLEQHPGLKPLSPEENWMLDRTTALFSLSTHPATPPPTVSGSEDSEKPRQSEPVTVTAVGIPGLTIPPLPDDATSKVITVNNWATTHPITYALYAFLQRASQQLLLPPRHLALFSTGNGVGPDGTGGGGATARLIPSPSLALLEDQEESVVKPHETDLLAPEDLGSSTATLPVLSAIPAPFLKEPTLSLGTLANVPPWPHGKDQRTIDVQTQLGHLRKWKATDPRDLLDQSIAYYERLASLPTLNTTAPKVPTEDLVRATTAQKTLDQLRRVRTGFTSAVTKRQRELIQASHAQAEQAVHAAYTVACRTPSGPTYHLAALVVPRGTGLFPPSASSLIRLLTDTTNPTWVHIHPALDDGTPAGVNLLSDPEVQATWDQLGTSNQPVLALYVMELPPAPNTLVPELMGSQQPEQPSSAPWVQAIKQATIEDNTSMITELATLFQQPTSGGRTEAVLEDGGKRDGTGGGGEGHGEPNTVGTQDGQQVLASQEEDADARAAAAAAVAAAELVATHRTDHKQYAPPPGSPPQDPFGLQSIEDVEMSEANA